MNQDVTEELIEVGLGYERLFVPALIRRRACWQRQMK